MQLCIDVPARERFGQVFTRHLRRAVFGVMPSASLEFNVVADALAGEVENFVQLHEPSSRPWFLRRSSHDSQEEEVAGIGWHLASSLSLAAACDSE